MELFGSLDKTYMMPNIKLGARIAATLDLHPQGRRYGMPNQTT